MNFQKREHFSGSSGTEPRNTTTMINKMYLVTTAHAGRILIGVAIPEAFI